MINKDYIKERIIIYAAYCIAYFSPTFTTMLTIGFFVVADFVSGILAAKKKGEEITSSKMRNTISKGCGYMIAILAAHVLQRNFISGLEVMKIIAGLIAMIEVKSLDENIRVLTGRSLFRQFTKK